MAADPCINGATPDSSRDEPCQPARVTHRQAQWSRWHNHNAPGPDQRAARLHRTRRRSHPRAAGTARRRRLAESVRNKHNQITLGRDVALVLFDLLCRPAKVIVADQSSMPGTRDPRVPRPTQGRRRPCSDRPLPDGLSGIQGRMVYPEVSAAIVSKPEPSAKAIFQSMSSGGPQIGHLRATARRHASMRSPGMTNRVVALGGIGG